jgi:quinol monooxygenase YgiN
MPITRRQLAALSPAVLLPSWAAQAQAGPTLLAPDGLAVARMGGQAWLVGELGIHNGLATAVELQTLAVSAAGRAGPALLRLTGAPLLSSAAGAKGRPAQSLRVPPGESLVLFLWHRLDMPGDAITSVQVECSLQGDGAVALPPLAATLPLVQPTRLGPPLRGGPWAAVFDPAFAFGHRRAVFVRDGRRYIPARFAIDWIKLDAQGKPWSGDTGQAFERWHGWGQEVLAVADGEIVDLRDGRDDVLASKLPAERWTDEDVAGNYLCLGLGGGRFVFYEHLQRGSIAVVRGQRVKAGEVIAKVGRSGVNSSGPHLHFHLADEPSTLQAQGRPYVFAGFRPLGQYGSMEEAEGGRAWAPWPDGAAPRVHGEMPAPNAVLMFDEPGGPKMYGLIGKMLAKPGQRDALITILLQDVGTMPGCQSYVVAREPGNEQAIWITEVWDDKDSHQASLSLPAVKAAIQRAMPLIQGFEQHQVTEPVGGHGLGG